MKSNAVAVAAYLAELPPDRREIVSLLREMILREVPDAAEAMSHGMPSYDLRGLLCALASQKQHLALYVCEPELVESFKPRLGSVDVGKSCIRFRRLDQLALPAVEELLRTAAAVRRSGPSSR